MLCVCTVVAHNERCWSVLDNRRKCNSSTATIIVLIGKREISNLRALWMVTIGLDPYNLFISFYAFFVHYIFFSPEFHVRAMTWHDKLNKKKRKKMTQNNLEAKKSVCVREIITHEQCMNIMKIKMRRIVFCSQAVRCTLNDFEKKRREISNVYTIWMIFGLSSETHFIFFLLSYLQEAWD